MGGTGIIIGLVTLGGVCAIAEKFLENAGKIDYANYCKIASIAIAGSAVVGAFLKFIAALKTLG